VAAEDGLSEAGKTMKPNRARDLYLDLLAGVLTRAVVPEEFDARPPEGRIAKFGYPFIHWLLGLKGLQIVRRFDFDPNTRAMGGDWNGPPSGETMVGLRRLDNLRQCIDQIIADGIEGDFIETGVWRGGACIFMRAALEAYGEPVRQVWVADSFAGLPKPEPDRYPADAGDTHWRRTALAISLEEVKANFARYGLLDERVRFLEGWFRDTLPAAPINKLSLLRLDGDMYESTIVALQALYPKLSPGGFLIVDDYALRGCRRAIEDYRSEHRISETIIDIDGMGAYWRKTRDSRQIDTDTAGHAADSADFRSRLT
jgi:O-methyltransferase